MRQYGNTAIFKNVNTEKMLLYSAMNQIDIQIILYRPVTALKKHEYKYIYMEISKNVYTAIW